MHRRLVALVLTSSVGLLGACDSGSTDSGADPSSSPTASSSGTGAEPVPALRLRGQFGTGSYCLNAGKHPEDHLWSGTWLAAHEDATITGVSPVTSGNLEIAGSWVVEDERDDGEFGPWSEVARSIRGDLVPLKGAQLAGGASYRVVLRVHPHGPLPNEISGLEVEYTSEGEDGTVTDDSTLRFAAKC